MLSRIPRRRLDEKKLFGVSYIYHSLGAVISEDGMEYFFNFEKLAYLREHRRDGCILCMVRDKDDAVSDLTVFKAEGITVCLNLYPYNPGHVLVFPDRHVVDIRGLSGDERKNLDALVDLSLTVLDEEYQPSGYNVGCNMGFDAGASINHLHMHIIPRYAREIGIAELLAGKRVLVENPLETQIRLKKTFQRLSGGARKETGLP
jgi:ATP adenylyltransferase